VVHGYLVEFRSRVRFGFADAERAWTRGTDELTSSENGFAWNQILEVERTGHARLGFRWNAAVKLADPFLGTFVGRDEIVGCRGRYAGQEMECLMLDEHLAADVARRRVWKRETFAALSGARVSLIALDYDGAVDGLVRVDGDELRVSGVERSGRDRMAFDFPGGRVEARCVEEDVYRLYQHPGGPLESPISCRLSVRRQGREELSEDAAGHVEFIDPPGAAAGSSKDPR
jgi:hypothetical protein